MIENRTKMMWFVLFLIITVYTVQTVAQTALRCTRTAGSNSKASSKSNNRMAGSLAPDNNFEPFAAIAKEIAEGKSIKLKFNRTELDNQAQADAQVAIKGRTLLVQIKAKDLPEPSRYKQEYYVVWVDIPNFGQKIYIGDLPLYRPSGGRGNSDTAYYNLLLPEGAVFGGLMVTAEPKRYMAVPSEPLNLLLVAKSQ